jgi:hypothetical protein
LETDNEKKIYKLSSEYLIEIEGVFGKSEKTPSSSNQVLNSNIKNDKSRGIIKKPAEKSKDVSNKKEVPFRVGSKILIY